MLRAFYDGEIRFVTDQLGKLLAGLELGDNVLYVLTSDHGEAFYEHGWGGHSTSLYEAEVRVPLLIRFPDGEFARHVKDPVSIIDVMPTILDYLGFPVPSAIAGRSLMPLVQGERALPPRPVYGDLSRADNDLRFVREGRWKLITDLKRGTEELYDLELDPGELANLVEKRPAEYRRLATLLREYLEAEVSTNATRRYHPLDSATSDALSALGYAPGEESSAR